MKEKAFQYLENLSLNNIHNKIEDLRLQLRNNTEQQFEYIRKKILNHQVQQPAPSEVTAQIESVSSLKTPQVGQQTNGSPHFFLQSFPDKKNNGDFFQADQSQLSEPTYYKDIRLVNDIDWERIKIISSKKISAYQAQQYFKYTLPQQIEDKIYEIWQALEGKDKTVDIRKYYVKISKMGVHFTEAVAIQIPIIKKNITLKKLLFEIAYKLKQTKLTWQQMKEIMSHYLPQSQPSIDQMMKKFKHQKTAAPSNHFYIPVQLLTQLKNIFRKNVVQKFMNYCSVRSLVNRIQSLIHLEKYMSHIVRPKTNYETGTTMKEVLQYIKRKGPYFVDLDELLLYFSAHPYAFYPIQERFCQDQESTLKQSFEKKHRKPQINKVRSARQVKNRRSKSPRQSRISEYMLSNNNPNSIRNRRLQQDLQDKASEEEIIQYKFKARPYSKSQSQQKYSQFMATLDAKMLRNRIKEENEHIKSQQEVERLKKQTKLFQLPKHERIQPRKQSFTARKVPEVCLSPRLAEVQGHKNQRRNKILSETKFKYFTSWQQLPHVATLQKESPQKKQYSPPPMEIHQIPNYQAEHQRMQYELEARKLRNKTTQTQQFHLRTEERHPYQYKAKVEKKQVQPKYDYKQILYSPEPQIYYTQKFNDLVASNKNRAYQQALSKAKKLEQERERKKKHANFAKFMKNPLSKLPNTAEICQLQSEAKIQRHKKYWKNLDRQYENELNDIYSKAIRRPFLYEIQTARSSEYLLGVVSPKKKVAKKKKKQNHVRQMEEMNNRSV